MFYMELNGKIFLVFVIGLLIVMGVSFTLKIKDKDSSGTGQVVANPGNNNPSNNEGNQNSGSSNITEIVNQDDQSSSGGGGSGGSSGGTSEVRKGTEVRIPHSLGDFVENQECMNYEEEICTYKIVRCSLKLENLDKDVSGIFEIKFSLLDEDQKIINSENVKLSVNPRESSLFEVFFDVRDENAKSELSCREVVVNAPKKYI
jgi:hypothetical protein